MAVETQFAGSIAEELILRVRLVGRVAADAIPSLHDGMDVFLIPESLAVEVTGRTQFFALP